MKKLLLVSLLFVSNLLAAQSQNPVSSGTSWVTVDVSKKIYPVHPDFWGTNFLFWVDDDKALANGIISKTIKEVGMNVLRYPGGTVADNFHWKTNTLENTSMFPYESGEAESDFDEFMKVCKETGAEPALVVNTETWAVKKDIAGGAHEAAEWLRYCKEKNYKVKYIEIGNETYWHPILSASEYGRLVNVYADSLRKVDPDIILGINGHWNTEFTGTKERVKKDSYAQLMDYRTNIRTRADYNRYTDFTKEVTQMPITKGEEKWWKTLAEICGDKIDMIIVHWYFAPSQLNIVTEKLTEVRQLFAEMYPTKNFLLNISEYNVTERTPESHMHLTEMIGNMLKAKTDITGLWPMRMKYKKPTLIDYETDQLSILFEIHKQLSQKMKGSLVESKASASIPSFATSNNEETTVVMTGSKIKSTTQVKIQVPGSKSKSGRIWKISGQEFEYKITEGTIAMKSGIADVQLSPGEVLILTLN